jgi:hypothetical protein
MPADDFVATDRFAVEALADELVEDTDDFEPLAASVLAPYDPTTEQPHPDVRHKAYYDALDRRMRIIAAIAEGLTIQQAIDRVGIQRSTYKKYRMRFPRWAAKLDEVREEVYANQGKGEWTGTTASFMLTFFGMKLAWFHLLFLKELERVPLGNILMCLWPPEHGKTTTFENWANMKLALDPTFRFLVASESQGIAQKINGRVMDRMQPLGPTPKYVERFGPFTPQPGQGGQALRQPWTDKHFRVYGARESDERNYSMEAVGARGSIVSARCDQLHIDDIQSLKTVAQTARTTEWIRQDALSRPAESGFTSIVGTRVGEEDVYEELLSDTDLDDIMKVLRFPAVITDHDTGEQKPLWEGHHTLESLDRMKRKVGATVWDRNWMQNPGASRKGKGTFTDVDIDQCFDPHISLTHHVGSQRDEQGGERPIVYVGVDPALGGKNCIMAVEVDPRGALIPRKIREDIGFERNEQIMGALENVVAWAEMTGNVTDVVIEEKNFQLGLKNDDRMRELSEKYGFRISGHMTGWNKYDSDIGVASMASSFIKKEIVLPNAPDDLTRHEIGEFRRQLLAWKPGVKGSKLRQDRVMAFWFVWMLWRSRFKSLEGVGSTTQSGWKRQTTDWTMTTSGLVLPKGA